MTWVGREIDLELSIAAWRAYDYNYPREFPEYLYVSMTGTSTKDTGQPCSKYVRMDLAKSSTTGRQFCERLNLTKGEWAKVPTYRKVRELQGTKVKCGLEGASTRVALVAIGVIYAILLFATTMSCL